MDTHHLPTANAMMRHVAAKIVLAAACLGIAAEAQAQWSNRPFSFQNGWRSGGIGAGASVGMTPAYRQLMLERKLLGRPTENNTFTRGADGSLINIERRDDLAFGRFVAAPYVLAYGRQPAFGGGFAVGFGGVSFGFYGGANLADGLSSPLSADPSPVPIDSWIQQLDLIQQ